MKNNYQVNYSLFGTHKIISSIIGTHKKVLDVGCNTGYLAKLAPRNTFVGIDYAKELTDAALASGYKKVYTGDLNIYRQLGVKGKYDVVVFADILEHLNKPEKVLTYFVKNHVKKGGLVLISLPNVAHFSIRFNLLFGRFNYTNAGILDKTHLHLYTLLSGKKLINGAGLRVVNVKFSSNIFGQFISLFPVLGTILGFNLIYICRKS